MPSPARFTALLAVAFCVLAIAACGVLPGLEPLPPGPLVTIETRGGECVQGACGRTIAIEPNGRVHASAPAAAELGTVPAPALLALQQAVSSANYARLAGRPFVGQCPVAFDGQETIYTFRGQSGLIRLASCEVAIDPADPLFVAIDAALASVAAI
jgi:hypothetical protein